MRAYAIVGLMVLSLLGAALYMMLEKHPAPDEPAVARAKRDRPAPGERQFERPNAPHSEVDLESRVAKLENEVATLRRQLVLGAGGRPIAAAFDDQGPAAEVGGPQLDTAVREIVANEREREREERWQRRTEQAVERLTDAAALTDEQQTAIAALWDTERERITPVFMEARAGDKTFDEAIAEVEVIREETDAEAKKLLAAGQVEAYGEHRPRGPGGRREGGRGGGGRDGPP